jgi:hypothetical protein
MLRFVRHEAVKDYNSISNRGGLVAAFQNRIVEVGNVRFACVERYDHALALWINFDLANAVYAHERLPQSSHAFVAILPFGCDFDCFQNRPIAAFRKKGTARVGIIGSRWVHVNHSTRPDVAVVAS